MAHCPTDSEVVDMTLPLISKEVNLRRQISNGTILLRKRVRSLVVRFSASAEGGKARNPLTSILTDKRHLRTNTKSSWSHFFNFLSNRVGGWRHSSTTSILAPDGPFRVVISQMSMIFIHYERKLEVDPFPKLLFCTINYRHVFNGPYQLPSEYLP